MATKLFVNLPVTDLEKARAFFTHLGFEFFGAAENMTSIIISDHTQVMLIAGATFDGYTGAAPRGTEAILCLGVESRAQVDELVGRALAQSAFAAGPESDEGGLYQKGFTDLDGHQWSVLHLAGAGG